MPSDFRFFTDLPVLYLMVTLILLPATALSALGQWLLARKLGFDRQQRRRILWFPLLAPIAVLLLSRLVTLGLPLPEFLDYALLIAADYLYCNKFIPRLDQKQLNIFFPASIGLTLLAMPVYYLFL